MARVWQGTASLTLSGLAWCLQREGGISRSPLIHTGARHRERSKRYLGSNAADDTIRSEDHPNNATEISVTHPTCLASLRDIRFSHVFSRKSGGLIRRSGLVGI
ncbi:hypothetical protein BDV26DRAFT_268534 [Aspergillus bertholletiae]|uniref:Secreted protein n=1 Tax=Aspergillus bertholletiae TaxID=1226010 RepID=A0A5N7B204_9EURO|nr:hypothetical protein BDV26DRAFT_268534 [Aspergillus bertholletiae]